MSLKRPAAGGESCEAGFFFMHTGAQMKLLGTYVLGLAESEDQDENGI